MALLLGWRGLWLMGVLALSTAGIVAYYRSRLGCVTGDMLGAMVEALEALLFLLAAAQMPG